MMSAYENERSLSRLLRMEWERSIFRRQFLIEHLKRQFFDRKERKKSGKRWGKVIVCSR